MNCYSKDTKARLDTLMKKYTPTFLHFARAWHYLYRHASRRTLEMGLSWIVASQVIRFAQALGWMDYRLGITDESGVAMRMVLASNEFYAHLWPSPIIWFSLLLIAFVSATIGLHQGVAAILLTRAKGNLKILSEQGEDSDAYFTSVNPVWLMIDVRLRRFACLISILYFAQFSWIVLVHTGLTAILWLVILYLFSWTDSRLYETSERLKVLIRSRKEAEYQALRMANWRPSTGAPSSH